MEIRVRIADSDKSHSLHDGTLEEAKAIVDEMRVSGVYAEGDLRTSIATQFVIDEHNGSFFEIVVGDA